MRNALLTELKHPSIHCLAPYEYFGEHAQIFPISLKLFLMIPDVFETAASSAILRRSIQNAIRTLSTSDINDFTDTFNSIYHDFKGDDSNYDPEDFIYDIIANTHTLDLFKINSQNVCITDVFDIPSNNNLGDTISKDSPFLSPKYLIFSKFS